MVSWVPRLTPRVSSVASRNSLRDGPLSTCGGFILTRFTGVGKPSHCGWRHSLSQNPALCRTERTSWAQHSLPSAPWLLVQRQAPPPWLPSRDGLCLQSGSLSRSFPPEDSSAGELYPLRHRGRVTWGESSNVKFQLGQEMHGTAHCDPERLFCLFNKGFSLLFLNSLNYVWNIAENFLPLLSVKIPKLLRFPVSGFSPNLSISSQ